MALYTPQEKAYYDQLFSHVDKDSTGILPGQDAYPFLTSSNLSTDILGQIWALADPENNGFLTKDGWYKAARIIGWMQKGGVTAVEESLVSKNGPYPAFSEGPKPPPQAPLSAQLTGQRPISANNTGSGLPPLTHADRAKFTRLFAGAGPVNGLVSGDRARDIFVKSGLSYEKLGQIWNLSDTHDRGSLDLTDFIIGMHLIQSCMTNSSLNLPAILPPGLYQVASGGRTGPTSPIAAQNTGAGSPIRPQYTGSIGPLQAQGTGGSSRGTPVLPTRQFTGASLSNQHQPWDVTPQAKASSDQFFSQLDPQGKGVIEGDVAVPFMLQSQLDEGVLANIWDLADIRKEGNLTRDEFAVAMHLINQKLAGQDPPSSLPISLVPPSLREDFAGKQEVIASPAPPGVSRDLFDLFADEAPVSASDTAFPTSAASVTKQTEPPVLPARNNGQLQTSFLPQPPPPPARRQASGFATQVLSPHSTGTGKLSQPPSDFGTVFNSSSAHTFKGKDLMSDEEAQGNVKSVPDHSAEYGNKQNHFAQTSKAVEDLTKQHSELNAQEKDSKAQLEELEEKLKIARERHQTELRAVAEFRIRVGEQQAKIKSLNTDLITTSSDLSALRSEKTELEQILLTSKEEIRSLQKQMKDVEDEKSGLRIVLERLRKEARQQKGLVTIAKKQLQTAEISRNGVQTEVKAVQGEIEEDKAFLERGNGIHVPAETVSPDKNITPQPTGAFSPARLATATSVPLPGTPHALSPTPTAVSQRSNNPFDKFLGQASVNQSSAQTPALSSTPLSEREKGQSPINAALTSVGAAATGAAGLVAAGVTGLYETAKQAVTNEPEHDPHLDIHSAASATPAASSENKTSMISDAETEDAIRRVTPAERSLREAEEAAEKAIQKELGFPKEEKEIDPFGATTQKNVDPFGMPSSFNGEAETDPFGASLRTSVVEKQTTFDDFDDGFGDSFGQLSAGKTVYEAPNHTNKTADFDSAFAEFDETSARTASASAEEAGAGVESNQSVPAASRDTLLGIPKSEFPQLDRPNAERSVSTQAVASDSVPPSPVADIATAYHHPSERSTVDETPLLASEISTPGLAGIGAGNATIGAFEGGVLAKNLKQDEEQETESSDGDEGPEDLEGPKRDYNKSPHPSSAAENETLDSAHQKQSHGSVPALEPFGVMPQEDTAAKSRRSAPPPPATREILSAAAESPSNIPTAAVLSSPTTGHTLEGSPIIAQTKDKAAGGQLDLFGTPVAGSTMNVPAQTGATSAFAVGSQQPKSASFDEDDFDFSDLPPAQVDANAGMSHLASSNPLETGFDDEFASFDNEFENPAEGGKSEISSENKSFEMVSPHLQPSNQQTQGGVEKSGGEGLYDEWGLGPKEGSKGLSLNDQNRDGKEKQEGLGFDDAFGGDFEPSSSTPVQTNPQQQGYAPPPGPPPSKKNLQPAVPEKKPSEAQKDDIEHVKKLCAMGFSRGLVVEALAANGYDFQKTLNVLLS
nr:hypothetical protein L203_03421 [Cryptococcus depauperatus CBS 7841]